MIRIHFGPSIYLMNFNSKLKLDTQNESSQSVKLNQSEECEIDILLKLPQSHNYWSLVTRDLSPGLSLHKLSTNHIKCRGQLEQLAAICPPCSVPTSVVRITQRLAEKRTENWEENSSRWKINWPEKWNWLLRNLRIHKFRLCCYNFRLGWNQINSSSKFQPQKMSLHLSFYSWRPRLELNLDPILRSITLAIQNKPHVSGAFSSLSESTMCILCG